MENLQNNLPLVSIIIPCHNEEKFIGKCLDSILEQDYPSDKLEVFVIDGISQDKTLEIAQEYSKKNFFIKVLQNSQKITAAAFNIGIKSSRGEIIILMGAHAQYHNDYISKCVKYLIKYNVDNVGGILKTLSGKNTAVAKAIAISLFHPFGAGGAYFRTDPRVLRLVDTVFGGCYKKEVFQKIGLFNENLARSSDMEFNLRLKKIGGKILLVPDIVAYYYPTTSLRKFCRRCFVDGFWAIYPLKFGIILRPRHFIPLVFISTLMLFGIMALAVKYFIFIFWGLAATYLLVSLFFCFSVSAREKNIKILFPLLLAFACRHFVYGFGSLVGLIKVILNK